MEQMKRETKTERKIEIRLKDSVRQHEEDLNGCGKLENGCGLIGKSC